MSAEDVRAELAEVLATTVENVSYSVSESTLNPGAIQTYRSKFTVPRGWQATALADVVLTSNWLAEYVASKQAEVLVRAADHAKVWDASSATPNKPYDHGVRNGMRLVEQALRDRADRIAP